MLAAVAADPADVARLVDPVGVDGIGHHQAEVEGPALDGLGVADPPPGLAHVVGAVEGRVRGLDDGVDVGRVGGTARAMRPSSPSGRPLRSSRQVSPPSVLLYRPLPGPPERKKSGAAAELPHGGVHDRWARRVQRDVGAAGVLVDVEDPLARFRRRRWSCRGRAPRWRSRGGPGPRRRPSSGSRGSMTIWPMRSVSARPICCQVSPPSTVR